MAGQALRCSDLDLLRGVLDSARIPPLFSNDFVVCLAPADALGSLILFHEAAVTSPWAALAA
jgi:hypothetical protein